MVVGGTGDQLFANVDTCQSRLGLFEARQAAKTGCSPSLARLSVGFLGSQITGLPLMLGGTEPETERTEREKLEREGQRREEG